MDLAQRLRRDARRLEGDAEAAALLQCLGEHLFDPALDGRFMTRVCGAPRAVRNRLAAKVGRLKDYLTELRMIEARRWVVETDLPIGEIGKKVGYTRARTFRRAFHDGHGVSPRDLRRQVRKEQAAAATAPAESTDAGADAGADATDADALTLQARALRLRRQRDLGMFDPGVAAELRRELRRRYPRLDAGTDAGTPDGAEPSRDPAAPASADHEPVRLAGTGDRMNEIAAAATFDAVFDLPEPDLRFAMLDGLRLGGRVAFDELFRRCRRLAKVDGERAVGVARLGVEAVEPHRPAMGARGDQFKALAWVELGGVQEAAGDCGGAEQSLRFAAAEVGGEKLLEPWVEIEARQLESDVRWQQRRHAEAARAADRVLELARALEPLDPNRRSAVLRRLELATAAGDAETALARVAEFEELLDLAATSPAPAAAAVVVPPIVWYGLAAYHRAKAYVAAGQEDRARRCLHRASKDVGADEASTSDASVQIVFTYLLHDLARLCHGERLELAERLLRVALANYRRLGMPILEVAVEAELAAVCALSGQPDEARRLAAAAADFLDGLPSLHREAWQAARRLRSLADGGAEATEAELTELLEQLRHDLDLVTREIATSQAIIAAGAREQPVVSILPGKEAS